MRKGYTLDGRRKDSLTEPRRTVRPFKVGGARQGAFSPSYQNPRARTSPNTIKREEELAASLAAARERREKERQEEVARVRAALDEFREKADRLL